MIITLNRIVMLSLICLAFCATASDGASKRHPTQEPYIINSKMYYPIPSAHGFSQKGIASWYGDDFHGKPTSNGEKYDMHDMTAAHKTLPMDTIVLVKNLENGRMAIVRINDRGPFVRGRIIDLSYSAGKALGLVKNGTAEVQLVALAEGWIDQASGSPTLVYQDLSVGEFYVQIGAFEQKINAIKLQKRFTEAGHTTVIQKYFGPESVLYRVQVYAGKSLQQAENAERALLEHGYVGAFIIAR
ncbi:MAG: septal ring lytic transglycosylase RlpA family protein [Desulforhopalus sp.]